jgi:integrase
MPRLGIKQLEKAIADKRKAQEGEVKPFKVTVDRGLYLRVATDGVRRWFVSYTVGDKRREVRLPAPYGHGLGFMSLEQAASENARIQAMARDGVDFQVKKEQARIDQEQRRKAEQQHNLTVNDLFDAWVKDGVARQNDNAELKRLFNKDILPALGGKPLRELNDKDILAMLRQITQRGVVRLAVVAYKDTSQMLAWGEKRQPWRGLLINGNPCDLVDVNKLLPADYEEERDRTLSPAEIRELHNIFQCMEASWLSAPNRRAAPRPFPRQSQLALWICLGTLCRIGELLMARWDHVELDKGVWYIPRENVKGGRGKKQEHYVFLSDFAKRQFQALQEITGKSEWLFPSKNRNGEVAHVGPKSISKGVGDRQERFKDRKPLKNRRHDNTLVLAGGAHGDWTPHDLRRTGATMMQGLGVTLDVIDRCQNHLLAGRVRRVYLRHDYEAEKTAAWKMLGDRLDAILAGGAAIVELRRA